MRKISLICLFLTIISFVCSSSENPTSSSSNNVYFNFKINNKDYSSNDYEKGDICWSGEINPSNSKVDLFMGFKDPANNINRCGVILNGLNNSIGTTNGCDFGLVNWNEVISCYDVAVKLTSIGDFYEGTFSGSFDVIQTGSSYITKTGTGSFRVPKIVY